MFNNFLENNTYAYSKGPTNIPRPKSGDTTQALWKAGYARDKSIYNQLTLEESFPYADKERYSSPTSQFADLHFKFRSNNAEIKLSEREP